MSKTQEGKKDQSPAGKKKEQTKTQISGWRKGTRKVAEYQEFIRFMAFPQALRQKEFGFVTEAQFGSENKINPGTLSQWKKRPDFWESLKATWKSWGRERTPDVIIGLYRKAVNQGGAPEALAWMKIVEDWKEKTETEFSMTRQTLQTLQEQQREIIAMAKKRRAKR